MAAAYLKNVPGDFYVEDACCLTCGVPMGEAPEFFEMDEVQCFVKHQPETPVEFSRMLDALMVQEVGCIRYRGLDREFIQRLVNGGESEICDAFATVGDLRQVLRPFVRFNCHLKSAAEVATKLTEAPREAVAYNGSPRYEFRTLADDADAVAMEFSWYGDSFHKFNVLAEREQSYLIELSPTEARLVPTLGRVFHAWLTALPGLSAINWMSDVERNEGIGQPLPF